MKAKFKVGDILRTTEACKQEGRRMFGKGFEYENFIGTVTKVYENTNDQKDGMGDIWNNTYVFDNGETISEVHLEAVPLYRMLIEHDSNYLDMQSIAIFNETTGKVEVWLGSFKEAQQYIKENGLWSCDTYNGNDVTELEGDI